MLLLLLLAVVMALLRGTVSETSLACTCVTVTVRGLLLFVGLRHHGGTPVQHAARHTHAGDQHKPSKLLQRMQWSAGWGWCWFTCSQPYLSGSTCGKHKNLTYVI